MTDLFVKLSIEIVHKMRETMTGQLARPPYRSFDEACRDVLQCMKSIVGLDTWMITRVDDNDWAILDVNGSSYDVASGDVLQWSDSFCSRMVKGQGPSTAMRASEVEAYRTAPIASQLTIGAYVGVPIVEADGSLFGTICAIDPNSREGSASHFEPILITVARLLATLHDHEIRIGSAERESELLALISHTDPLTSLHNRRAWDTKVDAEEKRCQRHGSPASIMMIDLDAFKVVNDTKGHAAGDALLRQTAEVLQATCRETDFVARIGGDEFAILAVETHVIAAGELKDRLVNALHDHGIRASVGGASRETKRDLIATIEVADAYMYESKRAKQS